MAAAAATTAAAAGSNDATDDFLRVYRAVSSGASEGELRRVIDECAQGDDQRRKQAVNHSPTEAEETPLQAAHHLKRGDLVGALVEAGGDVGGILFDGDCKLTPLAVCITYGQVGSVRALLRAGHDANELIEWCPTFFRSDDAVSAPAAHFCLAPPPVGLPSDRLDGLLAAPQIGCLEVLLREGGVHVDARDSHGATLIRCLAEYGSTYTDDEQKAARDLLVSAGACASGVFDDDDYSPLMTAVMYDNTRFARFLIEEAGAPVDERSPRDGRTALHCCGYAGDKMAALLLDAGADVDARTINEETPLMSFAGANIAATCMLLDRGASIDVVDEHGRTPLIAACERDDGNWLRDEGWPLFQEILRGSSAETRCSRWDVDDESAVDLLASVLDKRVPPSDDPDQSDLPMPMPPELKQFLDAPPSDDEELRVKKRCCWAISELLASGAPLLPGNAARLLLTASGLSADQHAKLAARLAELCSWRAHETFVGVSLDFNELRRAEREVEEKRARLAALERELGGLGGGQQETDSSSSSSDGEGGNSSDDESGSSSSGDGEDDDGESNSEVEGGETEEDAESDGEESEAGEGAATSGAG